MTLDWITFAITLCGGLVAGFMIGDLYGRWSRA